MIHSTGAALANKAFDRLEVRSGCVQDIEAMALLTERTNADRAIEPLPRAIPEDSKDYNDLLERQYYKGYWSFLAVDGERLAGFTAGYLGTWKGEHDGSNTEYLWLLMVDPDYQKRGLGRALLQLAEAAAYEDGASSVVLWADTANTKAIRLYESEGYKKIDTDISARHGEVAKYLLELA